MTKFPHDEFAKEYLSELCQDYGESISSADIKSEKRQVDILFTPTSKANNTPNTIGLLGKILTTTCLLEVYRNGIEAQEILQCIPKLVDVIESKRREARRQGSRKKLTDLPILWIITPTISDKILEDFGGIPNEEWINGVYFLPKGFMTRIIAVHQLPVNPETLWLRILGKGKVQTTAIEELKSLPENFPHRDIVLELIYGLWDTLRRNQQESGNLEVEDLEVVMSLRNIFQERLAEEREIGNQQGREIGIQEGKEIGIQEGIQQNLKNNIISLLEKRFGIIPFELIDRINSISDTPKLQNIFLETISINSIDEFEDLINL